MPAPANSIPAFDAALKLGGDGIELDVRRTQDGVLVIHHDKTFWSGGRRRYVARSDRGSLNLTVPSVEEVLAWIEAHPAALVDVEVKEPGFEQEVVERLRPYRDRVFITSFVPDVLAEVRRLAPGFATGFLAEYASPFSIQVARLVKARVLLFRDHLVTRAVVDAAASKNIHVFAWDSDSRRRVRELAQWGVTGFITDDIPEILAASH
jgi:glycerophosphoryl diester phosphodiesterase